MAEAAPPQKEPRDPSGDGDRARAVADVLRDQARRAEIRGRQSRRNSWRVGAVAAALALVSVYLWTAQPSWLRPSAPPPVPQERLDASLRFGMYVQALQIEAFRSERGRLPDVLAELGEPLPGMEYFRVSSGSYRLTGRNRAAALSITSVDSLESFLGDAPRRLGIEEGGRD